jgi:hypothetical protein
VETQDDDADDDENIDESMMDIDEDASLDMKSGVVIGEEGHADDDEDEEVASDGAPVTEVVVTASPEDDE